MTSRWALACVVASVVAPVGAVACGGSSSETPFPQSADEVLPEMAAASRARPPGSSGLDLPPSPTGPSAGKGPPKGPSTPAITVTATATSTATAPPGAPPPRPAPF